MFKVSSNAASKYLFKVAIEETLEKGVKYVQNKH